ncbi:MAG: hypothetical protein U0941_16730 [Planctomycetaceae bacterium]
MVILPRPSNLRTFALVAVIYLAISIIANAAGQTTKANPDENLREVETDDRDCPPFGKVMPPNEILLTMVTDRLPRYHFFNNYPGEGRAMRARNDDLSVWFSLHFYSGVHPLRVKEECWIDSIIRDGFLTPLSGQIYRWTGEDLMLRRIPNHPLARPPEDCIGLLHLPMSSKQHSLRLGASNSIEPLSLVALQLRRGDPEQNEADSVLFDISIDSEKGYLFGPSREPNKPPHHPHWIRVGQYIETVQWRLKVLRVVHSDENSKIDGWVDLRVEPTTQATERPPAPHLPQDFDIPDDPDIPYEPDDTDEDM